MSSNVSISHGLFQFWLKSVNEWENLYFVVDEWFTHHDNTEKLNVSFILNMLVIPGF